MYKITKTMNLINKNQPPAARGPAIQVQKRLKRPLMLLFSH